MIRLFNQFCDAVDATIQRVCDALEGPLRFACKVIWGILFVCFAPSVMIVAALFSLLIPSRKQD